MLSSLIHVGVKQEKVSDFFLKNLDKFRKLDKENFDTILLKYPTADLSKFLLSGIIAVSEGKTLQATDGIKLTLQIEAATLKKKSEVESKRGQLEQTFKDEIIELNKYREKNPQIQVDKEISRLEKNIAEIKFGLILCIQEATLIEAKKELANSCLDLKGVNPSSVKTKHLVKNILNAKLSGDLENIIVKNALKAAPKQLAVLQAAELQMELARQEYNEKKDVDDNREISKGNNVHNIINEFYKTGELKAEGRSMYKNEYEKQGQNLKKTLTQFSSAAEGNQSYFSETISKKYKSISEVPPSEAQTVIEKLTGQMALLKSLFGVSAKYIGVLESRLVITGLAETKKEIQDEIKDCKLKAEEYASQFNDIGKFLGVKEDKYLKGKAIDDLVRAPIALPLLQKEIVPYHSKINQLCNNIAQVSTPLNYVGKIIQEQAERNEKFLPYQYDRGIGMIANVVSTMQSARTTLLEDRADLNRQMLGLKDSEKYDNLPDSIKFARKKVLENLINQIDDLLDKKITAENISKLKDASADLIIKRDQTIKYKAWSGVATTFIFCSAIGLAVLGGIGAGAVGAKLFTGGTVASNIGMGTLSMTGVAAGGVLGSRGAMQVGSWLDIGDYGGWKKIWNTKDMAKEFALGFALSVAAVGSAKLLVKGLSKAAKSEELAIRFPGFSKFSKTALDKLDGVSRFASPSTWFEGAEAAGTSAAGNQARRNFLRKFGNQTKEELYQESMEEAAGKVNKTAEFLVSLASASKGGARLGVHGLKASGVGISVEGNNLTYTTKTAQEFVRDFTNGNPGEINTDYKIKINSDNSVTIELMSGKIDPKTGVSKIYSVIDVKPAMEIGNITTDVEFARVRGLTAVEGKANVYTVQDVEQGLDVLGDFYSRGFNVVKTEAGNIKISKGDQHIELSAPAGMMAMLNIKSEAELTEAVKSRSAIQFLKANVVKIKEYFLNINIKKSFQELVVKWQGNYANFLENSPRLAKMLPADLLQIRFIPVPVIGLTCGIALDFKSTAEVAGVQGDRYVEISESQKLFKLGLRLKKIGMERLANQIVDPKNSFDDENGYDLSTNEKRMELVAYLETEHQKIQELTKRIKTKYKIDDVEQLLDYSKTEWGSLANRKLHLENFVSNVEYLAKYGFGQDLFPNILDSMEAIEMRISVTDETVKILNGLNYKPENLRNIFFAKNILLKYKDVIKSPTREQYIEMYGKFQESLKQYLSPKDIQILFEKELMNRKFSIDNTNLPIDFTKIDLSTKAQPTMEQIANMAIAQKAFEKIEVKFRNTWTAEQIYESVITMTSSEVKLSDNQKRLIFEKIKLYKEQQLLGLKVMKMPKDEQIQFIKEIIKKEIGSESVVIPEDFEYKIKYIENIDGVPQVHIVIPRDIYAQMERHVTNYENLSEEDIKKTTSKGTNADAYNKLFSFYRDDVGFLKHAEIHETAHAYQGLFGIREQYSGIIENIDEKTLYEKMARQFTSDFHLMGDEIIAYLKAGVSHNTNNNLFATNVTQKINLIYLQKWAKEYKESVIETIVDDNLRMQMSQLFKEYNSMLFYSLFDAGDEAVAIMNFKNGYNILKITPINRWAELHRYLKENNAPVRGSKDVLQPNLDLKRRLEQHKRTLLRKPGPDLTTGGKEGTEAKTVQVQPMNLSREQRIKNEDEKLSNDPKQRETLLMDYIRRGKQTDGIELMDDLVALMPVLIKAKVIDFSAENYDPKIVRERLVKAFKEIEAEIVKEDQQIREHLQKNGISIEAGTHLDADWYKVVMSALDQYAKPKGPKNPQSEADYAQNQRKKLIEKLSPFMSPESIGKLITTDRNSLNLTFTNKDIKDPVKKYVYENRPKEGFVRTPKLSEYKGEVLEGPPNLENQTKREGLAVTKRGELPDGPGIIIDGNFGYDKEGKPLKPKDKLILDHHDSFDQTTYDTATKMVYTNLKDPAFLKLISDPQFVDASGRLRVFINHLDSDSILSTWVMQNRNNPVIHELQAIITQISFCGDFLVGSKVLKYGATGRDYEYILRGYIDAVRSRVLESKVEKIKSEISTLESQIAAYEVQYKELQGKIDERISQNPDLAAKQKELDALKSEGKTKDGVVLSGKEKGIAIKNLSQEYNQLLQQEVGDLQTQQKKITSDTEAAKKRLDGARKSVKEVKLNTQDDVTVLNHMLDKVEDIIKNPFKYQKFMKAEREAEQATIEKIDALYREGKIEIKPDSKDPDLLIVTAPGGGRIPRLDSIDGEYFYYRRRPDFNRKLILKTSEGSYSLAINTQTIADLKVYDFNILTRMLKEKEGQKLDQSIAEVKQKIEKGEGNEKELKKQLEQLEDSKQKNTEGLLWRNRTQMVFNISRSSISQAEFMDIVRLWKVENNMRSQVKESAEKTLNGEKEKGPSEKPTIKRKTAFESGDLQIDYSKTNVQEVPKSVIDELSKPEVLGDKVSSFLTIITPDILARVSNPKELQGILKSRILKNKIDITDLQAENLSKILLANKDKFKFDKWTLSQSYPNTKLPLTYFDSLITEKDEMLRLVKCQNIIAKLKKARIPIHPRQIFNPYRNLNDVEVKNAIQNAQNKIELVIKGKLQSTDLTTPEYVYWIMFGPKNKFTIQEPTYKPKMKKQA